MGTIGQIWYTWSTIGVDTIRAGYRVRAASPGMDNLQDVRYISIAKYLQYQLPQGIDPNSVSPEQAPLGLTFAKTDYGKILVQKKYIGHDGIGRAGNYFAHLLVGLPANFTARDAILLWRSPFWQIRDMPQDQHSTTLESLTPEALSLAEHSPMTFDFTNLQEHLQFAIEVFLTSTIQHHLYIVGSSEQTAMLIWGLTSTLPPNLVAKLSFSTYEPDVSKCREVIIGTTTAQNLPPVCYREGNRVLNCAMPPPTLDSDSSVAIQAAEAIAKFRKQFVPEIQPEQKASLYIKKRDPEIEESLPAEEHDPAYEDPIPVVGLPAERKVPPQRRTVRSVTPPLAVPVQVPVSRRSVPPEAPQRRPTVPQRRLPSKLLAATLLSLVINILLLLLLLNHPTATPPNYSAIVATEVAQTVTARFSTPPPVKDENYDLIGLMTSSDNKSLTSIPLKTTLAISEPLNTPFIVLVVVRNTGKNFWVVSHAKHYTLSNVGDSNCSGANSMDAPPFTGKQPVYTNQIYIFSFQFELSSPDSGGCKITLQMASNSGTFIGSPFTINFTITS